MKTHCVFSSHKLSLNCVYFPKKTIRMKILIAEDNLFTAQQYLKVLENNGHEVTITQNGNKCIEEYTAKSEFASIDKHPFDVVLLDNNMPEKTGAEVAKSILEKNPEQRIIFASAYDIDSLLKVSGKVKNSVEVLQKPFSLATMLSKIERK